MNDTEMRVARELAQTPAEVLVIVDFDETLILDNSTKAYLATARPMIVAALVSRAVVNLGLYRVLPGRNRSLVCNDWLRVVLTTILLPWTLPLWWYVHAPRLAQRAANRPLLELLATRPADRVVVVSHGVPFIVRPLLRHMAPQMQLFALPQPGISGTRRQGKHAILERALGPEEIAGAMFVSGGDDNAPLLGAVARPVLARWPGIPVRAAFQDLYVPFHYTERSGKRSNYLVSGVLLYDIPVIALAYAWNLPHPLLGGLGLALMYVGLWCIYELGYLENDRIAQEQREVGGTVPPGHAAAAARITVTSAWSHALLFSSAGLVLLLAARQAGGPDHWHGWTEFASALAQWATFLLGGRVIFAVYNRSPTNLRFLQYPWLHCFRFFGYALFVQLNIIGALLIVAMIIGRWIPYLIYRLAGPRRQETTRILILMSFLLTIPAALAVDAEQVLSWQTLAAVAWLFVRAIKEIREILLRRSAKSNATT